MEIGESVVKAVILHQVGNRLREEPLILAEKCFAITESISQVILGGYFRGIFSERNKYVLSHESDMALNDVAHHSSSFFREEITFEELSKNLASHLYSSTHHPNVASGDLFVILFDNLKVDGECRSAIGIYKSESKQQYLSAHIDGQTQKLEVSIGINPDLIDKGVLIISGSDVIYAIDRLSSRTKYWIDDFLKAKQIPDERVKSAVATGLIEKVRENIESPTARQDFYREVIALCNSKEKVLGEEIREVSEKYVHPDLWSKELDRLVERKGLVDTREISISAKKLQAKLSRIFNRINIGNDIGLVIPDGLIFSDAVFTNDGDSILINVTLERNNG